MEQIFFGSKIIRNMLRLFELDHFAFDFLGSLYHGSVRTRTTPLWHGPHRERKWRHGKTAHIRRLRNWSFPASAEKDGLQKLDFGLGSQRSRRRAMASFARTHQIPVVEEINEQRWTPWRIMFDISCYSQIHGWFAISANEDGKWADWSNFRRPIETCEYLVVKKIPFQAAYVLPSSLF